MYPSTSPAPADSTPQFTSPPGQPSVSTANRASNRLAVSLSSAWEKQGLHNVAHPVLSPKSTFAEWQVGKKAHPVLSPEPTFAEWQAGKKAHLSVFKLPSNPPSEWLLIKNVSSQVDETSLREVCNEFGRVHSLSISPSSDLALVSYSSREEAMQAKSGLDKSPVICGTSVCVDFALPEDFSNFHSQTPLPGRGHSLSAAGTAVRTQEKWPNSDKAHTPGVAPTLKNGSRWEGDVDLPHCTPRSEADRDTSATLWSNNAFLSGLSSPWANHHTASSSSYPPSTSRDKPEENHTLSSSPPLATYLPNGLF